MKILTKSSIPYIPEWNRNRKEPEESRIEIGWNYLSGSDKEIVFGLEPIQFNADGEIQQNYTLKFDNKKLLEKSIKYIKHLDIGEDEQSKLATVEDICQLSELAGLYRELVDYFMAENKPEGKKK